MKKLKIRIRPCEDGLCKVWLIGVDGTAQSGIAHGVVSQAQADALAQVAANGYLLEIERSQAEMPAADEPRPATEKVKQDVLFKEEQTAYGS